MTWWDDLQGMFGQKGVGQFTNLDQSPTQGLKRVVITKPDEPLPDVGEPAIPQGPQFSAGHPVANAIADNLPGAMVSGILDTVKTPGNLMKPNPYPAGSEEADWYDSQRSQAETNWAPGMALNTMGTGGLMGVAVNRGEQALGSGILRRKKDPPVLPLLHGTGAPVEYTGLKPPPATHDLGIHATIADEVPRMYAFKHGEDLEGYPYVIGPGEKPKIDFMSGKRFDDPDIAGPRTKPYVGDFRAALNYPVDAGKFNVAGNVIQGLEDAMRKGFVAPRGLLEDMYNISKPKDWQSQFIPMLESRGYDSMVYPHAGSGRTDTVMGFRENQFIPRFSEEGAELIRKRGIAPLYGHKTLWTPDAPTSLSERSYGGIPKSILSKPKEYETLTKNPRVNTAKWWEESAPDTKIKQIGKAYEAEKAKQDAAHAKWKENWKVEEKKFNEQMKKLQPYKDALAKGEMTNAEYAVMHDKLLFEDLGHATPKTSSVGGTYSGSSVHPFSQKIKGLQELEDLQALNGSALYKKLNEGKISEYEFYKLQLVKDANWDYHNMTHAQKWNEAQSMNKMYKEGTLTPEEWYDAQNAMANKPPGSKNWPLPEGSVWEKFENATLKELDEAKKAGPDVIPPKVYDYYFKQHSKAAEALYKPVQGGGILSKKK